MLNGIALLAIGAYGAGVIINGRVGDLFDLLKNEGDYVVWAAALAIVIALYQSETTHPIGKMLLAATVASLAFKITANKGIVAVIEDVAKGSNSLAGALKDAFPSAQQ